ncbi:uncharacterized protein BKA55DRAFT_344428 [Fusarium redolens]|uniref:F-box domain-containing protein n=1 Tax=Fusarium redolens TaxID=48865 RepID=A0A9P9H9Y6_FUSRE|nr:uncharacterized protein BKA55DRAFT_344428 [Fusarium redolens]KAH7253750.1 hypothetical protein BKA55DRAFT_344428 [Fusarium redolens]
MQQNHTSISFAQANAIMLLPLKLHRRILDYLDFTTLSVCRLVCHEWNALVITSFGKDFIYHFNTTSLDSLSSPNLMEIVKEIIVSWAMPTKEWRHRLSTQLAIALASRTDISLRCYNELSDTGFKCDCTRSPSTDYAGYQFSSLWIAFRAIASQPHIKLQSLILSNSVNDNEAEARLLDIRSLIQNKLIDLEDLVLCYTNPTEYEDLHAFLSCCQRLKRLCLRVRTFKALDGLNFPSLQYLRMDVQCLDGFALKFLERHANIEAVYISYFGYDVPYHETTGRS